MEVLEMESDVILITDYYLLFTVKTVFLTS